MTDVLLCVGNSMMGDDGAGPLLAEMCAANPAGQWVVIDGGSAPENDIVAIRELRPERLLIVDATDMGLNPGDIRIIDPDDIAEMFMMTTHNMPLNYLVDQLKEDVGEVIFLGIQPDIVGFYYPMTQPVKEAVARVYQQLAGWQGKGGFTQLEAADDSDLRADRKPRLLQPVAVQVQGCVAGVAPRLPRFAVFMAFSDISHG